MAAKDALGRRGEQIAARHLEARGLSILDRLGYMTVVKGGRGRSNTFEVTDVGRQSAEG